MSQEHKLARRLLVDQRFSYSGFGGAKVVAHTLQSHQRSHHSDEKKVLPEHSRHDFWGVNISLSQSLLPVVVVAASYQAKELVTCQG